MKLPPLFALHGEPKFVTDGCSGYMTWAWLKIFGHKPPWDGGCVIHDWYYWSGGRQRHIYRRFSRRLLKVCTRREADAFLFNYVRGKGYPAWAWLMWLGVRLGGSQYLPFSWRWRYRERYRDVLGV